MKPSPIVHHCYTVEDTRVVAIVEVEDAPVHTAENGYRCNDATCPCNVNTVEGTVYLIHFERPYKHAAHYLGYAGDLAARITAHRVGRGASRQ